MSPERGYREKRGDARKRPEKGDQPALQLIETDLDHVRDQAASGHHERNFGEQPRREAGDDL